MCGSRVSCKTKKKTGEGFKLFHIIFTNEIWEAFRRPIDTALIHFLRRMSDNHTLNQKNVPGVGMIRKSVPFMRLDVTFVSTSKKKSVFWEKRYFPTRVQIPKQFQIKENTPGKLKQVKFCLPG